MSAVRIRRRVLVVPDASPFGLAAVERAVELAQRIDAELSALFLEDADLFRLAALPFAAETGIVSGRRRPLEPALLEAHARREARRIQQALAESAGRRGLAWSFRVQRGSLARDALLIASGAEAVFFGVVVVAAVVPPRRTAAAGRWVLITAAEGNALQRAVDRVLAMADGACRELLVLLPGTSPAAIATQLPWTLPPGAPAVTLRAAPPDLGDVLAQARRAGGELLILTGAAPGLTPEQTLGRVLGRTACPVLWAPEPSAEVG